MIQCVLGILEIGYIKIWDLRPSKALILGTLRRIRCSEGNGYSLRTIQGQHFSFIHHMYIYTHK